MPLALSWSSMRTPRGVHDTSAWRFETNCEAQDDGVAGVAAERDGAALVERVDQLLAVGALQDESGRRAVVG